MHDHQIGGKGPVAAQKRIEDLEMFRDRLPDPEGRGGRGLLRVAPQPVMNQQRRAQKAVSGTARNETVELGVEAQERALGGAHFALFEMPLQRLAQAGGLPGIKGEPGRENRLRFKDHAEGQAFIHGVGRIEDRLEGPGLPGLLGDDSVPRQYF